MVLIRLCNRSNQFFVRLTSSNMMMVKWPMADADVDIPTPMTAYNGKTELFDKETK